jgi:ceramide glucosyltransferase
VTPWAAWFLLGALLLVIVWATHGRLARALRPRPLPPSADRHPSVSVIRPVRGIDPGAEENARAALRIDYPGPVQTIFVLDDDSDPALPLVERALDEHRREGAPGLAEIVFCGPPPPRRTGKVNAMIAGLEKARGTLVAFVDSDVRAEPAALCAMVDTLLSHRDAGCVFAPVVSTAPARGMGDALCASMLNGLWAPVSAVLAWRKHGELPFVRGRSMVMTREALRATGELEDLDGELADDLAIGVALRSAGLRCFASAHSVRSVQQGQSGRQALQTLVRWLAFWRSGRKPWPFYGPIVLRAVVFWLGVLGAVAFAAARDWRLALPYALAAATYVASAGSLHQRAGGAPLRGLHRLAPALLLLLAPFLLLRSRLRRRVAWRGRDYDLDRSGRLASSPPALR